MHEAALARAALPAPCQVLGLPLRPYSLGHELYLLREGIGAEHPTSNTQHRTSKNAQEELIKAVALCSESWASAAGLQTDWLLGLKMWIWKRRLRRVVDWEAERQAFENYREAGSLEFPLSNLPRQHAGPAPRPPGCPFLLRLHQFLVTKLRLRKRRRGITRWGWPRCNGQRSGRKRGDSTFITSTMPSMTSLWRSAKRKIWRKVESRKQKAEIRRLKSKIVRWRRSRIFCV